MAEQFENKVVDRRVAHRYVKKGLVDEKDFEKYLKNLPDLAQQAVSVEASMEGEALDDADEEEDGEGGSA